MIHAPLTVQIRFLDPRVLSTTRIADIIDDAGRIMLNQIYVQGSFSVALMPASWSQTMGFGG